MHVDRLRKVLVVVAAVGAAAAPTAFGTSSSYPSGPAEQLAQLEQRLPAGAPPVGVDPQCYGPAGHPKPQTPAWSQRDLINQYCALGRTRDQLLNPSYGYGNLTVGAELYVKQWQEQLADGPGHIHGGITTQIPGALGADPLRAIDRWEELTGGRAIEVKFPASDGAQLRGHIWLPPKTEPAPPGGYPGVVITDGSVQAYENLYYWAAEGLAQYGYEVMTFDPQGQGHSDLLPKSCTPDDCPGVPYQQEYNFSQGTEDALNFFLSAKNPGRASLDAGRVGIAGHSLGATAVSWVGQCDNRVRAIVAWDDLATVDPKQCAQHVTVPPAYRSARLHTPALATTNDYEFNVQPSPNRPNPHGDSNMGGGDGDAGYRQLAKAGVDSELVSFRNGTHLTYSYIDLVLPSNELSERFAFFYTLAWFDEYLRNGHDPYTPRPAYARLTNLGKYDDSADRNRDGVVSIGAGVYDPQQAAADPTDLYAGNVPYRIQGVPIRGSLSFYFYSEYRLTDPRTDTVRTCTDMLARCPNAQPKFP